MNSSKKVERTFRYGPYGENTKSEGTQTIPDPFGYKGSYRTPGGNKGEGNVSNGLYHFGARYYDPTTGRWTQQDPEDRFGSTTQGDRFLFAGDNPLSESDPSGLFSEEAYAIGCGSGAVVGGAAATVTGPGVVVGAAAGCVTGAAAVGVTEFAEQELENIEETF